MIDEPLHQLFRGVLRDREMQLPPDGIGSRWSQITVSHSERDPVSTETTRAARAESQRLRGAIREAYGVYVYVRRDEVLYIGKGKPIRNRIIDHYKSSYRKSSGDRNGTWHRFFKSHLGELTVLWTPVDGESERRIVEGMLEVCYKSLFEKCRAQSDPVEPRQAPPHP